MLTSDLVRATLRRGEVKPQFIDAGHGDHLALAEALIDLFQASVGETREHLDGELAELLGTGTAFLLHRGLAKLLRDRCELETVAPVEPAELRQAVFTAAAASYRQEDDDLHPIQRLDAVVEEVCGELGLAREGFDHALYGDLKGRQVLTRFEPLSPEELLHRYNSSLAQAVLLRARELSLEITGQPVTRYRALLRKIKFFQLLHRVEKIPRGYRILLDGPLSLFQANSRYGLQMASFLPTLLHFKGWKLEAQLLWGPKRRPCRFELTADAGLQAFSRLTGQWLPEELSFLPKQWKKLGCEWSLSTKGKLIPLGGQGVLVPDYVFRHDPSGREVAMEVFGYWNRGSVASRLKLLEEHGPSHFILAISRSLAGGAHGHEELPEEVYVFRTTPIARQVLKRLRPYEP